MKAEENTVYPSPSGFYSDNEDNFYEEEDDPYDGIREYDDASSDPEDDGDFLGEVMEAHLDSKSRSDYDDEVPPMKKVMRIFKEDLEDESEVRSEYICTIEPLKINQSLIQ